MNQIILSADTVIDMMDTLSKIQKLASVGDIDDKQAREIWRLADQIYQTLEEGINAVDAEILKEGNTHF